MTPLRENAERWPDRLALCDGSRRWSWRELYIAAEHSAMELRSMGVGPGDIVASLMDSTAEHVLLLHATWLCGAAVAPLNTRLAPPEHARQLSLLRPRLLVTEKKSEYSDVPIRQPDDALCSILFTSGTAGTVKAVPHTWDNHRASAEGSAINLGVRDDDNWLCVIPLFHIGGLAIVTRSLFYGTAMTLAHSADITGMFDLLRRERVTLLSVVPTHLQRLLETKMEFSATGLPALRAILLGGAAASASQWQQALSRGLPVLGTYGLTESCSQVVTASPESLHEMAGSAGRPIGGAELRICDDEGVELPAGMPGEIRLRGPMLTSGYLDNEALNARVFVGGWYRTGDSGLVDSDGLLHVLGRIDDMIITGGENVFPAEIEDVLIRYPSVSEAAVAGVPDEHWGMRVAAVVVLNAPTEFAALESWCREHLAGYKIPRIWKEVDELPRTGSGKVRRAEVRAMFVEDGKREEKGDRG